MLYYYYYYLIYKKNVQNEKRISPDVHVYWGKLQQPTDNNSYFS